MKTGIATALSVAGVLAAGAAAFAVNNSVLGSTNAESIVTATTLVAPAATTAPVDTVAPGGVNANATQISSDTTTYRVGAAGSVVVDTSSGAIVVTGIAPSSGYTSEPAVAAADGSVKVHFRSSGQRIEFIARMVNGQVKIDVRNESTPTPASIAPAPRHHDDDDDEGDDDDHEFGGFSEDDD